MHLRLTLLSVAACVVLPAAISAQPNLRKTDLFLGDWQDSVHDVSLYIFQNGQALAAYGHTTGKKLVEHRFGNWTVASPGVWRIVVRARDGKLTTYSACIDRGAHRLLVHEGSRPTMVFLRTGRKFEDIDRDGNGLLTEEEVKGTPFESRFNEFVVGRDRLVDRRGYEAFLEKYPQLGSAK